MTSERGQIVGRYEDALQIMRSASPDAAEARRHLEAAIADGDPRAHYALATWYLHGTHVEKSLEKGVRLLAFAADRKVRDAIFDLAVSYERARGVARDRARAFQLYKEAADLGDPQAMAEVGRMLFYGIGVAKDRDLADRWLAKAEQGERAPSRPLGSAT